jgi:hypothetical protein
MASSAALLPFPALLAGCVIVTGSTDGYQLTAASSTFDAGAEAGEAGSGLTLGCVSAADCSGGGDGAASVCCLSLTSTTSAATECGPSPCGGTFSVQLCKLTSECASDSGTCTSQSCSFGTASVTIQACGTVFGCTPF